MGLLLMFVPLRSDIANPARSGVRMRVQLQPQCLDHAIDTMQLHRRFVRHGRQLDDVAWSNCHEAIPHVKFVALRVSAGIGRPCSLNPGEYLALDVVRLDVVNC